MRKQNIKAVFAMIMSFALGVSPVASYAADAINSPVEAQSVSQSANLTVTTNVADDILGSVFIGNDGQKTQVTKDAPFEVEGSVGDQYTISYEKNGDTTLSVNPKGVDIEGDTDEASGDIVATVTEEKASIDFAFEGNESQEKSEPKSADQEAAATDEAIAEEASDKVNAVTETESQASEESDKGFVASANDEYAYSMQYILNHANSKYVDLETVDIDAFAEPVSFARGIATYNNDKQSDFMGTGKNFIASMTYEIPIYDVSKDSKYYVAMPNVAMTDSRFGCYDFVLAYNNDNGEVIDGAHFEDNIAYIPKTCITKPQNDEPINAVYDVAMQLNYYFKKDVTLDSEGDARFTKKVLTSVLRSSEEKPEYKVVSMDNLFDGNITVPTGVDNLSDKNVKVFLNGMIIPVATDSYGIDGENIVLYSAAGVVSSVNVVVQEPTKLEAVGNKISNTLFENTNAGPKVNQASMYAYKDENGEYAKFSFSKSIYVGWRGSISTDIDWSGVYDGKENRFVAKVNGKDKYQNWRNSLNYMYGGYIASGSDPNKQNATWAIVSYAAGSNRATNKGDGKLGKNTLIYRNSATSGTKKTIYAWMKTYANSLERNNRNTNLDTGDGATGNGIGGNNNFGFKLFNSGSTITPAAEGNLVPSRAAKKSTKITFKATNIDKNDWFAGSCSHLDDSAAGTGNSSAKKIFVTCIGRNTSETAKDNYVVLAFTSASDNPSSDKAHQIMSAIYKFRVNQPSVSIKKVSSGWNDSAVKLFPNNYSLKGAKYRVYKGSTVSGASVGTFTTKADGTSNSLQLDPGTYTMTEIAAPKGFKVNANDITFTVSANKLKQTITVKDTPLFGSLHTFAYKIKKDDDANNRFSKDFNLAGAVYQVCVYDTITTKLDDLKGLKPVRTWNLELKKNPDVDLETATDEELAKAFKTELTKDYLAPGSDDLLYNDNGNPVIPRSTITIKEIKPAFGYTVDSTTYIKTFEKETVDGLEVLSNTVQAKAGEVIRLAEIELNPSIGTTATDKDTTDRVAVVGDTATIVDKVSYTELQDGLEYTIKGVLMDKATGEPFIDKDGSKVTAEKTFTVNDENSTITDKGAAGSVDIEFTFDSNTAKNKDLVVFEELYCNYENIDKSKWPVVHKDIEDEGQTVEFPEIKTNASDIDTGDQVGSAKEQATVVDAVHYSNLIPGKEYEIKGTLMNKETNEPLLDAEGNPVTASTKLIPSEENSTIEDKSASGTVNITFTFDASLLQGQTFVAFEDLYHNDILVYSHADINDGDQTVYYPEVKTTATDKLTETHQAYALETVTITDAVECHNLIIDKDYKIEGVLMDKETGEPLLDKNGETVTSSAEFTATDTDQTIDLEFNFVPTDAESINTVVFENLYHNDKLVASHADIEDEGQTVEVVPVPELKTTAVDKNSGNHITEANENVTIVDTVEYTGMIPGVEYTVKGTLMDKETGKPAMAGGEKITAETTFTPTEPDGSVDVEFSFDGTSLGGKEYVVFEKLFYADTLITSHEDIDDESQTVVLPKIETTATDKDSGKHSTEAAKNITITDEVKYTRLIPGVEYTVKGTLMDKDTKKPLKVNGKTVTSETKFTPTEANGTVNLDFTFNGSSLGGKELVAFEKLFYADAQIASHEDIDDESQTVEITKPGPETGNTTSRNAIIALIAIGVAAAAIAVVRRKKK